MPKIRSLEELMEEEHVSPSREEILLRAGRGTPEFKASASCSSCHGGGEIPAPWNHDRKILCYCMYSEEVVPLEHLCGCS